MCKEQGPQITCLYMCVIIYICVYIYIKTFLTEHRRWAQQCWGKVPTVMPRPEVGK